MQSTSRLFVALLASTVISAALAQQPAEPQTRTEEPKVDPSTLEPAVDTSATTPDSAAPGRTSPESIDPAVDTSAATPAPSAATAPGASAAPGATTPDALATPGTAPARANRGSGRALDRLELDTTQITGNRELPKVLYIVPWKRADLGDLVGKPVNSLLDDVLEPVDRDVFKRENRYYRSLQAGAEARSGEAATQGGGPEK